MSEQKVERTEKPSEAKQGERCEEMARAEVAKPKPLPKPGSEQVRSFEFSMNIKAEVSERRTSDEACSHTHVCSETKMSSKAKVSAERGEAKSDKSCDDRESGSDLSVNRSDNSVGIDSDKDGKDDYRIAFENKEEAWSITDLNTGKRSRIWGDPHVDEQAAGQSDGENSDFEFLKDSTFMLKDGTKISVATKPDGNGNSYSDKLTITNGEQGVEVCGIADNNVKIGQVSNNGRALDAQTNDGHIFKEGDHVADWDMLGDDGRLREIGGGKKYATTDKKNEIGASSSSLGGSVNGSSGTSAIGGNASASIDKILASIGRLVDELSSSPKLGDTDLSGVRNALDIADSRSTDKTSGDNRQQRLLALVAEIEALLSQLEGEQPASGAAQTGAAPRQSVDDSNSGNRSGTTSSATPPSAAESTTSARSAVPAGGADVDANASQNSGVGGVQENSTSAVSPVGAVAGTGQSGDSVPAAAQPTNSGVPKVIFDSDMQWDWDDAGALKVLNSLADQGKVDILAMMSSTKGEAGQWNPHAFDAINSYHGRPDIPIGKSVSGPSLEDTYGKFISEGQFDYDLSPEQVKSNAVELYKDQLRQQPDNSVVIVTTGYLSNIEGLLKDPEGMQLVQDKVKYMSTMAGKQEGGSEANLQDYQGHAKYVFDNFPKPIIGTSHEAGNASGAGSSLSDVPDSDPVKAIYTKRMTENGYPDSTSHATWDHIAVLAGVFQPEELGQLFDMTESGTNRISVSGSGEQSNRFDTSEDSGFRYLINNKPDEVSDLLDRLMSQAPR